MKNQDLFIEEIGYLLFSFIHNEKEEYIRVFEDTHEGFWDLSWTAYFDLVNDNPHMTHYSRPYSVIFTIKMASYDFFYEDFDGKYCTCENLGEIINPKIFKWVNKIENLDIAVFSGLTTNGIPLHVLPSGGWRKIDPKFIRKYGLEAKNLLEKIKNAKARTWGSYKEYLKSEHWQSERKAALRRAENRCQVCNSGNKQLDVHHRTYERLGLELPADLIVLCNDCHNLFHKNSRLKK